MWWDTVRKIPYAQSGGFSWPFLVASLFQWLTEICFWRNLNFACGSIPLAGIFFQLQWLFIQWRFSVASYTSAILLQILSLLNVFSSYITGIFYSSQINSALVYLFTMTVEDSIAVTMCLSMCLDRSRETKKCRDGQISAKSRTRMSEIIMQKQKVTRIELKVELIPEASTESGLRTTEEDLVVRKNIKWDCIDAKTFCFSLRLICWLFKVIKLYSESSFLLFCHWNIGSQCKS